jgi:hypothetical protein
MQQNGSCQDHVPLTSSCDPRPAADRRSTSSSGLAATRRWSRRPGPATSYTPSASAFDTSASIDGASSIAPQTRSYIRWLCPRTYISHRAARCKSQVLTYPLSLPHSPTSCTRPSLSLPSRLRPLRLRHSDRARMHALRAMLSADRSSLASRYSASSTARTSRGNARTRP